MIIGDDIDITVIEQSSNTGSEKITERLAEYRETKDFQDGDMKWDGIFNLSKYILYYI